MIYEVDKFWFFLLIDKINQQIFSEDEFDYFINNFRFILLIGDNLYFIVHTVNGHNQPCSTSYYSPIDFSNYPNLTIKYNIEEQQITDIKRGFASLVKYPVGLAAQMLKLMTL